jgi:hypothetical protein
MVMPGSEINIRPAVPSAPDRYSRLFPPFDDPLPPDTRDEKLEQLAKSMKSPVTPIPFPAWKSTPVGAGYTYFGQFVDHDLTEDRTPLHLAGLVEPKDTENRRTCWLDLDNLYGHGPGCPIYGGLYEDEASFRLGTPLVNGEAFDVPLTDGRPYVADPRNNENIIVRQVHAMFLKLHNCAVTQLKKATPGLASKALFAAAQERVRWQYQWLVRHDFLLRICNQNVYQDVIIKGNRRIDWLNRFSIPVEFSQAAFRFGHSMVRAEYNLNSATQKVPLSDLFAEAKKGALDSKLAVNWAEFFEGRETSMRIDTAVVEPLFNLPDEDISRFVSSQGPHSTNALPLRTLRRGAANKLPTGQQVRDKLCPEADMQEPVVVADHPYDPWATLGDLGMKSRVPLWYYTLLEAEIDENGLRLGRVGSRLVLEVIEGSLLADPNSFLRRFGNDWVPPPWNRPDGSDFPIRTVLDVAKLVGLARD